MRFDCPKCHRPVEVEGRYIGKEANCPYCGKVIRVPAGSGDPPPVVVPVAPVHPGVGGATGSVGPLQLALLVVGVLILVVLFRIERQLASLPRVEDWYHSRKQDVPFELSAAERRAPVVSVKPAVEVDNEVRVRVINRNDDPVPVWRRE